MSNGSDVAKHYAHSDLALSGESDEFSDDSSEKGCEFHYCEDQDYDPIIHYFLASPKFHPHTYPEHKRRPLEAF